MPWKHSHQVLTSRGSFRLSLLLLSLPANAKRFLSLTATSRILSLPPTFTRPDGRVAKVVSDGCEQVSARIMRLSLMPRPMLPFGESGGTIGLEGLSAGDATLHAEMIVLTESVSMRHSPLSRANRSLTFDTCHNPPRRVSMPRSLNAAAMVRSEVIPVNRRANLTPYRRPKLTPLLTTRAGSEPTELFTECRRVRP